VDVNRFIMTAVAALAAASPAWTLAEAHEPGFSLQGEVGAGQTTRDVKTSGSVAWGALLGFHFAGPLGLELEYQHAENDLSSGGVGTLKQDGLLGHVRLDLGNWMVTPFLYAGAGWVSFHGSADVLGGSTADRFVVPGGVGVELHVRPIVIGARGEYQWNTSAINDKHVDYWKVVGTVGFRIP
jgi:hypothetical protein